MTRKSLYFLFGMALLTATAWAAVETVSHVFTLRYLTVSEATTAVQPLLSDQGSLTLQPSRSRITVQDFPEVVNRVVEVINRLDRSPDRYRVHVELLEGGAERPFGSADEVEATERLRKMFKFPSYRSLGRAVLEGELGGDTRASLGIGYQVSFVAQIPPRSDETPWGAPDPGDRIQLRKLTLERLTPGADGEQVSQEFLCTNVLLSPNQQVYIGAGSSEDSETGLVLIVQVQEPGAN